MKKQKKTGELNNNSNNMNIVQHGRRRFHRGFSLSLCFGSLRGIKYASLGKTANHYTTTDFHTYQLIYVFKIVLG